MAASNYDMSSDLGPGLPPIVPGRVILNGENPFIRLSASDGAEITTDASLWSVTFSPLGAGHALFIKSELTDSAWRIYTDNPKMVEWLQSTVQGMLNPDTARDDIPVVEAKFSQEGSVNSVWIQTVESSDDQIVLRWENSLEHMLMAHEAPSFAPERSYGVSVVMVPMSDASLTMNGVSAKGKPWPCLYDGKPFSTACLAFSESWRED
ncbi:MAG: hypothetical protein OIF51_20615 [Cellvibrionaceae bacterium]|nr:hypothetical protein [Cellvibrionaceae bacterium]